MAYKYKPLLARGTALALTAAMTVAALAPALMFGRASAGIPTSRKITIADSSASAMATTYSVSFVTDQGGAADDIGGIVIDFCDSPIIGVACGAVTGFDATDFSLDGQTGIAGFAKDAASTDNTLVLTNAAPDNTASGATVTLTLGGIDNPTLGNYTFYARILTFALDDDAVAYDPTALTGYIDAGGVALSTANQLVITSKVQERLVFCVYVTADDSETTCTDVHDTGSPGHSNITLGDDHGVLNPEGPFVDKTARMRISTNAGGGATIVMKGDTLHSGTNDIAAIGETADPSSANSEQFGMCWYEDTTTGLTLSNDSYNNADCNDTTQSAGTSSFGGDGGASFGFNTTNTLGANGDTLGTKATGTQSKAILAFIGNIDMATEAGIYQTTLTFIATGTY